MVTLRFQSQRHQQFFNRLVQSPTRDQSDQHENHRFLHQSIGHWLPRNRGIIADWVTKQAKKARAAKESNDPLDASLEAFRDLVDGDPALRRLANDMFTEASTHYPQDPVGNCAIQDFEHFLYATNIIIRAGPQWYDREQPETAMGMIGFPITALLNWPMGTASGYEFWLHPGVNLAMGEVLRTWGRFLCTPASTRCLDQEDGWLSRDARGQLAATANQARRGGGGGGGVVATTHHTFAQLFVCDPSAPHYGFGSWDAFFVREFREGIRPVEATDDGDDAISDPSCVVVNACESAPLQVVRGVKLWDTFYLKGQPYSLLNMLHMNQAMAGRFVGGTVYQAFLSALSYHRWHAPVGGTVRGIEQVPGTYYSENWFEGLAGARDAERKPDPAAPNYSQPYISAVATRGIIYIEADNPKIGLMAIVFIGMVEVSSCEFTVREGERIKKGQPIGMFHFGGSSHCMLFRPGVELEFVHPPPWNVDTQHNLRVNSALAVAS